MKDTQKAQSVEEIYKNHMAPDEYWYPNSAVTELQRKAFILGQQSQSDLVSKEKVIEILKSELFGDNIKTHYRNIYNEAVNDCISKIKSL